MIEVFYESYLLLVKICVVFCVLVMIYSLREYLSRRIREKKQRNHVQLLEKILSRYAQCGKQEQERLYEKIFDILKHPKGLLVLITALEELGWESHYKMDAVTRRVLCMQLTELYINKYNKSDEAIQSLLISLLIRCDASSSRLKQILLKNLEAKNLLVRIETLRCISSQRNRKIMIQALEIIDRQPQHFSNKLLTDALIEFQGSRELLMEEMWKNRVHYSTDLQVSMIQMMTMLKSESFAERVYEIADDKTVNKEVRIAAIKYFGHVLRPEYINRLASFLTDPVWEYGAVAANVLRNYECTEIFESLLKGSASRNWHVRNNCAKTIVACCSREQIREAIQGEDRYSRDSIIYACETAERREELYSA